MCCFNNKITLNLNKLYVNCKIIDIYRLPNAKFKYGPEVLQGQLLTRVILRCLSVQDNKLW